MSPQIPADLELTPQTLHIITALGELLPGGFFFYHADGEKELIGYNSKMLSLFGCDSDEEFKTLTHNSFKGLVHPDDYDAVEKGIWQQIHSNDDNTDHVTYRFVRKDGSVGMMDDYGLLSHSETFGDIFYVFVQDISEQYLRNQEKRDAELQRLIDNMVSDYHIVYLVDMSDDSLQVLRMDGRMVESKESFKTFSEAAAYTVGNVIHPRDREKMAREFSFGHIRSRLKETPSYNADYCILKNGATIWGEMNVTYAGNDRIVLSMAEHDIEIGKRQLEEKRYEEYSALYVVDIDTGKIRLIKSKDENMRMKVGDIADYADLTAKFAGAHKGEANEFFSRIADLDAVSRELATEDKHLYTFKSEDLLKGNWVDVTTYVLQRHEDGTPALFTIGFSPSDTATSARHDIQSHLRESAQMIGGLASEYHALYYYNIDGGFFKVYSLDKDRLPVAAQIVGAGDKPLDTIHKFGASPLVHPDDRHIFEVITDEWLREQLAHRKKIVRRFRRNFNGKFLWTDLEIIKYEDVDERANAIALGFAQRDNEIRSEQILNRAFNLLSTDIPPQEAIDTLIAAAGEFHGAERCYIFELRKGKTILDNTYEWCAPGVEPMIDKLQDIPSEVCEGWFNEFKRRGAFSMDALDSEHNTPEAVELLEMQGISSLVAAPLLSGNETVGFIGVDNPTQAMSDTSILKHVSSIAFSEILRRRENDEEHVTLEKLTDTFMSVYYADLSTDYLHNWKIDELGEKSYGGVTRYSVSMGGYISRYVAERDRERCLRMTSPEYILEQFRTKERFSVDMVDVTLGYERDYVFDFLKVSEDGSRCVISCTDVTESVKKEREQQRQLEEALAMAQAANRAKTTFLNNMSHDIRTPMNAIIGYTDLAASHLDNTERVKDYLSKIGQSSDHLLSLINDVLDMSRIESGKMNLDEKSENLPEIIHTLRDIVQADIHAKQHDFFIDTVDVNDENVICDKLRLNQVLLNILSNSIKYTAPGGTISMRITEMTVKPSGYATYEFRIKDNGMGMSEEFVKTLYDPFTRVKSSTVSGIQGTGLGMAITKSIIDMMGGRIEVQSELGKGTEIAVTFDFKLKDEPRENVEIPELKGLRGLVVDDDSNTCLSVSKMLSDTGMRYEWCTTGKEAVIRAEAAYRMGDLFKLYIIDWLMPDMNGIETVRRIRKVIGDDAPIIILTAYDWSDIEDEAREAGVTDFVSKPLFPSDLHRVLAKCIGKEEKAEKEETVAVDLSGKKILLVEDNELNREIATAILEEYGCTVYTAEDGAIAVEKMASASSGDYDLVLMDIQMPTIDGYEATRRIRALGTEISRIPILAMTANAFEEDRKAAIEAGMNEHIAKPIDIEQLLKVLSKFL